MEEENIKAEKQEKKQLPEALEDFKWKPGQSGNPKGRPKGQTLKEYVRKWLSDMTEEEKKEFLNQMPKELIWKMAEGMPSQDTKVEGQIQVIPLLGGDSHALSSEHSDRKVIEAEESD